ncbi:MAG: hypothetical protein H0V44_06550 [Planctomycetes bacterium]|nr:hypothetical protein [Planctomycetota bacterium]
MTMPAFRSTLTSLASLTLVAGFTGTVDAAVSNVDPAQQTGPNDLVLRTEFLSKHIDHGIIRNDDATARLSASGRWGFIDTPGARQGLGAHLNAFFAIGEDQRQNPPTSPFECTELDFKVDYLYEALDNSDIPLFQIIPHYEFITYPNVNEQQNYLKFRQSWLGIDAWYMLPWEGIEVGGGTDWNLNSDAHMFRAAAGAREFYQDAPFDLAMWQLINFGNRAYKTYFAGDNRKSGFTTLDVGGKVTLPLPWNEFWTYVQAQAIYWVDSQDRKVLHAAGIDVGEFIIGIGVEWRPE